MLEPTVTDLWIKILVYPSHVKMLAIAVHVESKAVLSIWLKDSTSASAIMDIQVYIHFLQSVISRKYITSKNLA